MFIAHRDILGVSYVWEDDVYGTPPPRFVVPEKVRLPASTFDGRQFLWAFDQGRAPTGIVLPQDLREAPVVFSREETERIITARTVQPTPAEHDSEPVLVPVPVRPPPSPYGRRPGTDIFSQLYPREPLPGTVPRPKPTPAERDSEPTVPRPMPGGAPSPAASSSSSRLQEPTLFDYAADGVLLTAAAAGLYLFARNFWKSPRRSRRRVA